MPKPAGRTGELWYLPPQLGFSSQLLTLDSQKQLIIIWVATLIYDSIGSHVVLEFSVKKAKFEIA